jgi:uncharacterized protein YPO0396
MSRRMSKEWEEEFEFLRTLQDDSIAMNGALLCLDKCATTTLTHCLLPHEKKCAENCLEKYNQSGLIVDFNYGRFQKIDGSKK